MASEPKVWKFSYSSKEAPLSLPAAQPPPSASKASSLPPDAGTPGTPAPAPLLRHSAHIDCSGSQQMCACASLLHLQLVCMTSRGEVWGQMQTHTWQLMQTNEAACFYSQISVRMGT